MSLLCMATPSLVKGVATAYKRATDLSVSQAAANHVRQEMLPYRCAAGTGCILTASRTGWRVFMNNTTILPKCQVPDSLHLCFQRAIRKEARQYTWSLVCSYASFQIRNSDIKCSQAVYLRYLGIIAQNYIGTIRLVCDKRLIPLILSLLIAQNVNHIPY